MVEYIFTQTFMFKEKVFKFLVYILILKWYIIVKNNLK